jgi:hypothetical protein
LIEEIHLVFRGGLEGYRYSSQIKDGVTTVSDSPNWKVEPYVGAGVIFYFFKSLSLSVEEVYVVDTGTETSFGFRLFI